MSWPSTANLMLVGERQGLLTKSGSGQSPETEIRVFFTSHEIVCPRSPASGLPVGKRHHKLLLLHTEFTSASIGIHRALTENEPLTARLRYFQPSPQGILRLAYTIDLSGASLVGVRTVMPDTRTTRKKGPGFVRGSDLPLWQELSFTYLRVQWTWSNPQVTGSDDWLIAR